MSSEPYQRAENRLAEIKALSDVAMEHCKELEKENESLRREIGEAESALRRLPWNPITEDYFATKAAREKGENNGEV